VKRLVIRTPYVSLIWRTLVLSALLVVYVTPAIADPEPLSDGNLEAITAAGF